MKPTKANKTAATRVAQVQRSMEGKDIIHQVKQIQMQKEQKANEKKNKQERKENVKEAFLKCKNK